MTGENARLYSEGLSLAYDLGPVVHDVSLQIAEGQITTLIGPNGCGKSTLLRALARLMKPARGGVYLDGQLIHRRPTREVAKQVGLLQQQSLPPDGITVEDLARRGRYPHQSFLQPPSRHDAEVVGRALELTGMTALRRRQVDQLSGGQRQRAWLAMALAQETPLLLLDEPTTYLDVAHQLEVIELVRRLNRDEGRTIVLVLHDINEAARVSDYIVAIKDGRIAASGTPNQVLQPGTLRDIYGVECDVLPSPDGSSLCVPLSAPGLPHSNGHYVADAGCLRASGVSSGYGKVRIIEDLSLTLRAGEITAIVGPNACGKSTLLRTIARMLRPTAGEVRLGDRDVFRGPHRHVARELALLTQGPVAPSGYVVEDLVSEGRHPHQSLLRQWSREDESAVDAALRLTDLVELRLREVESLSGGQRQRAWISMALAQDTRVLLLDEPTTFLDIGHQIEVLDLVRTLNQREHRTVVMVMHDLNLAARYADCVVVMRDGRVVASGAPSEVVSEAVVREVFGIECSVGLDARTGAPLVFPIRPVGAEPQRELEEAL